VKISPNLLPAVLILLAGVALATPKLEKLNDNQVGKLPAGGSIVIVNFWATWCAPCVEELPIFVKLQDRMKHIQVIGVSMDEPDEEAKIHQFLKKHPVNYRVALWTGNDLEKMVNSIDPAWNGPIPATFIFQNGKRIYSKVGPITEAELLKVLPAKETGDK
jgi:thiol-disulfide isomerase/thioredoxin